jgi:hypothetical protein
MEAGASERALNFRACTSGWSSWSDIVSGAALRDRHRRAAFDGERISGIGDVGSELYDLAARCNSRVGLGKRLAAFKRVRNLAELWSLITLPRSAMTAIADTAHVQHS